MQEKPVARRERSASLLSNCSSLAEKEALATSQILRLPSPAPAAAPDVVEAR